MLPSKDTDRRRTEHLGIVPRIPVQELRAGVDVLTSDEVDIVLLLVDHDILLGGGACSLHKHQPVGQLLVATIQHLRGVAPETQTLTVSRQSLQGSSHCGPSLFIGVV